MTKPTRQQARNKDSEQNILNDSYDPDFGLLAVENLHYDPASDTIGRSTPQPAVRFQADSTYASIFYLGLAAPGASESDPVWQIKKLDTNSGAYIYYADGDTEYDNTWNNRESYTYL